MQFPVQISFKRLSLTTKMFVRDAVGQCIGFVRSKPLFFKYSVTVFADETQAKPIYVISTNSLTAYNAEYQLSDATGQLLGGFSQTRNGSIWLAQFAINVSGLASFEVHEQSVLARVVNNFPFGALLTGYTFKQVYLMTWTDGIPALRLTKNRSPLQTVFVIDKLADMASAEQEVAVLGMMMIALIERYRG